MLIRQKFIAVMIVLTVGIFISRAALCAEVKATLKDLKGTVEVKMSEETKWTPAKEGMKVGSGVMIRCMAASSAFVLWAEGNIIKVYAMTTFELKSLTTDPAKKVENSNVGLTTGKILAKAKSLANPESSFEVKTPTAIAGVRGTDFGVEVAQDQTTSIAVISGSVAVTAEAIEMIVTESLQTVVEMGQPPTEPAAIPADVLQDLKSEVKEVGSVATAAAPAAAPATNVGTVTTQTIEKNADDQIVITIIDPPIFPECCLPRTY